MRALGGVGAAPMEYALDALAQRWGIAPWLLDTDDPEVARWVHRGLIFQRLEAQAVPKRK